MFEDVANVGRQIDFCDRASGTDRAQDIEHGATVAGFSELRSREHAFFNSQCALDAVICIMQIRIVQIERQFCVMLDHVAVLVDSETHLGSGMA